jgi:hypothetical protein
MRSDFLLYHGNVLSYVRGAAFARALLRLGSADGLTLFTRDDAVKHPKPSTFNGEPEKAPFLHRLVFKPC